MGLLAGALWGAGLGLRFCPVWIHPPALSAAVAALIVAPVAGLTGWAIQTAGIRRQARIEPEGPKA